MVCSQLYQANAIYYTHGQGHTTLPKRYAGIFEFLLPPFLFCETYANETAIHDEWLFCFSPKFAISLSNGAKTCYNENQYQLFRVFGGFFYA